MKVTAADPFVMYDKVSNKYYCYATSNTDKLDKTFYIYESSDKTNWTFVDFAFNKSDKFNWAKDWFWAPECYYNEYNGYYYLFYSARTKKSITKKYFGESSYKECAKLGVAVSKSPKGPFKNISSEPIDYYPYDESYYDIDKVTRKPFIVKGNDILSKCRQGAYIPCIDANIYFDKNKDIYLFFSRCCYKNCLYDEKLERFVEESNICYVKLDKSFWTAKTPVMPTIDKDFIRVIDGKRCDKFVTCISYRNKPQEWEDAHVNDYSLYNKKRKNRRWSEGSTLFDIGDKVYALYSCNFFESPSYGVGVCIGEDINSLVKYDGNPIIKQDESISLYSTGHGSLVIEDGKYYYFFHGRDGLKEHRSLYYCEIEFGSVIKVKNITQANLLGE